MTILRGVFSAKQVGILYHYTSPYRAEGILKSKVILGSNKTDEVNFAGESGFKVPKKHSLAYPWSENDIKSGFSPSVYGISLTRDSRFHRYLKPGIPIGVRLVLDGTALSENYKIVPFNYFHYMSVNYRNYVERVKSEGLGKRPLDLNDYYGRYKEDEELLLLSSREEFRGRVGSFEGSRGIGLPLKKKYLLAVEFMINQWHPDIEYMEDEMEKFRKIIQGTDIEVPVRAV